MPRAKARRLEGGTSFMYPSLHRKIEHAVGDDVASIWFQDEDTDEASDEIYSTHIMGNFRCDNNACSAKGWGSKKVTILIRGYPENGYNAVVFNQRCKRCQRLGALMLDESSYVDRVVYRLRKWAGVPTEQPVYDEKNGPPHVSALCEGCKRRVCRQGNIDSQIGLLNSFQGLKI